VKADDGEVVADDGEGRLTEGPRRRRRRKNNTNNRAETGAGEERDWMPKRGRAGATTGADRQQRGRGGSETPEEGTQPTVKCGRPVSFLQTEGVLPPRPSAAPLSAPRRRPCSKRRDMRALSLLSERERSPELLLSEMRRRGPTAAFGEDACWLYEEEVPSVP